MLAYKVVEKKTRKGSNWLLAKLEARRKIIPFPLKIMQKHREFYPSYFGGRTIRAVPGSQGIFCFQKYEEAERFITYYDLQHRARIIRLRGIGEPNLKPRFLPQVGTVTLRKNLIELYSLDTTNYRPLNVYSIPAGNCTFREVEVLD